MVGESPKPSHDRVLLNAAGLAILGLYETIELMKKEDGDQYWVADHVFTIDTLGSRFEISIDKLLEDFGFQFPWFEFQINQRKKAFELVQKLDIT